MHRRLLLLEREQETGGGEEGRKGVGFPAARGVATPAAAARSRGLSATTRKRDEEGSTANPGRERARESALALPLYIYGATPAVAERGIGTAPRGWKSARGCPRIYTHSGGGGKSEWGAAEVGERVRRTERPPTHTYNCWCAYIYTHTSERERESEFIQRSGRLVKVVVRAPRSLWRMREWERERERGSGKRRGDSARARERASAARCVYRPSVYARARGGGPAAPRAPSSAYIYIIHDEQQQQQQQLSRSRTRPSVCRERAYTPARESIIYVCAESSSLWESSGW